MKEKKTEIVYSDHVNEIISNPPGRIVRWGTAMIFIVFLILLLLAWLVKYPDIVPSPVEITTFNPPVTLVSKISGRINKLYVTNGEKVSPGRLLAVMETAASLNDFDKLKSACDSLQGPEGLSPGKFPSLSGLGELQPHYASFLKALSDYNTYITNDFYGYKIKSISEEIDALQAYISGTRAKEKILTENLQFGEKKYRRDSLLFAGKVLAEIDFENSSLVFNNSKLSLQEVRLEQSARTIELAEKRQFLQDYRITREEERERLAASLNETWQNLRAQTRIWENTYLLVSPVEGTVTFTKYWSENQSVSADEPVLSVVPENPGEFIGRIYLSMQRSGKVRISQPVNIKLSGFPYLEYGMVRGSVRSKSLVPSGDAYVIEVSLPDGLRTLYGKTLEFTQNMQGSAEIMTDDLRLLEKIINPFRHLASKNRDL